MNINAVSDFSVKSSTQLQTHIQTQNDLREKDSTGKIQFEIINQIAWMKGERLENEVNLLA